MSVLIKGMEMPTRCFSCPMCDVENAEVNCAISHGSYIEYRDVDPKVAIQERPSDCPLVEVPEDVQPILEYGGWTAEGNDEYGNYWDECTVCRRAVFFPPSVKNDYKYCPHCGAKMDGET